MRRFPQRCLGANPLVAPARRHLVPHPLPPALRKAVLCAVVRFAVHVLKHRGLTGVHAAHARLAVRGRPEPPVPQVTPIHGIELGDVRGRGRAVALARHDVRGELHAVRGRGGNDGGSVFGVDTHGRRHRYRGSRWESRGDHRPWLFDRSGVCLLPSRSGAVTYPEIGVSLLSVARCTESAMTRRKQASHTSLASLRASKGPARCSDRAPAPGNEAAKSTDPEVQVQVHWWPPENARGSPRVRRPRGLGTSVRHPEPVLHPERRRERVCARVRRRPERWAQPFLYGLSVSHMPRKKAIFPKGCR